MSQAPFSCPLLGTVANVDLGQLMISGLMFTTHHFSYPLWGAVAVIDPTLLTPLSCLQWGMICPAETPEGQACGLVKNLALMAYISVGCASAPVLEFLEEWTMELLEEISPSVIPEATKIFVNGAWVGVHRDPQMLVKTLRQMRRQARTHTILLCYHYKLILYTELKNYFQYILNDACTGLGLYIDTSGITAPRSTLYAVKFAGPNLNTERWGALKSKADTLELMELTEFRVQCDACGQVDINTEVGVVHDIRLQELRLYTDFGRCCRPLFIVDQQRLKVPSQLAQRHITQVLTTLELPNSQPLEWSSSCTRFVIGETTQVLTALELQPLEWSSSSSRFFIGDTTRVLTTLELPTPGMI